MTIEKITTALTPMGYNAKINEIIDKIGDSSSSSGGMGMPIGTEIALYCDTTYVPEGCVPCDGSEYSKSQFQDLWNNYLTSTNISYTINEDILTINGSPIIANGVVKNFTINDYLTLPYDFLVSEGYELILKCVMPAALPQAGTRTPYYATYSPITTTGVSYLTDALYTATLEVGANETFYARYFGFAQDGNNDFLFHHQVSLDGNTWLGNETANKYGYIANGFSIGICNYISGLTTENAYAGSVDLAGSYLIDSSGNKTFLCDSKIIALLNTCSYEEYEADLGAYGQCGKFAVNTALETFRVPYKKNGAVTQQALTTEELGKAYNEGLPNITATLGGIFGSAGALAKTSTRSNGSGDYDTQNANFNASRCSDVYGKTDDNSLNKVQVNAIALRFFVVIANGQLNQSMMDWSQWASSLTAKAEKTDVDGQWVTKITQILSTAGTLSQVRCDLSEYLPNDNYDYLVKFKLSGYDNDSTYGYYIDTDKWVTSLTAITSDAGISSPHFQIYGGTYARQTNTIMDLPVGSQRYVQVSGMGGDNVYLTVLGYRRLGRNV